MGVRYEQFREMILRFPGVEEAAAYGTPIFKVKKTMVARLTDEAETIVIKIDPALRSTLVGSIEAYFVTPHYEPHPLMLVDLKKVCVKDLKYLLEQAWRMVAPKKLIAGFEK